MQADLMKDKIYINKVIAEKKELFFVQDDMIVPDSKPDILNTINVTGNVCINKKEITQNKLKIEGNINTYVMYLPDSKEDNLRGLNCTIDFSENFSIPGLKEGMNVILCCKIKDIECKVINGRKISLKASVEVIIKVYSNEEINFVTSVNNVSDLQTLKEDFMVNSLIGNAKTAIYAKDTIKIEPTDELAEILKVDIKLVDKDIKLSYNKVLTKAEAEVNIIYLTEDNKIKSVVARIPVIGFIDIQNIKEDNQVDINYEIKNTVIKPNPAEEHSIYVELEIEPDCMAYENKKINLIQDLYSPTTNMEYSLKKIITAGDINSNVQDFTVKENLQLQGLEDGNLLDVNVVPSLNNVSVDSQKITYVGEMNLNFIYSSENAVNSRSIKIPFEVSQENMYKNDNLNIETDVIIANTKFDVTKPGEVASTIDAKLFSKISQNINMDVIDNIEIVDEKEDTEEHNSLILYIVEEGDTIWKIAKRFNSTVEEIIKMNGIQDTENLAIGQKIYIPKYNQMLRKNQENEPEPVSV